MSIFALRIAFVGGVVEFFENVAFETTLDAQNTIMIKSSMNTRKALVRRSQTMRYGEAVRKSGSFASRAVSCMMHYVCFSTVICVLFTLLYVAAMFYSLKLNSNGCRKTKRCARYLC